eukprot:CAMPEP_0177736616 /NCGR_PEP_ID=MMETSP0484_2-20121128/25435_1 /TAXON_ID=354590 /ORGANISM="Rhodomonas lens, Strain RHODO" /LENGTH=62 /DNA_ID=CAMNT_0019250319 /DNA_START=265 /DNA_END=450 /DNA_ORIENTATION=-
MTRNQVVWRRPCDTLCLSYDQHHVCVSKSSVPVCPMAPVCGQEETGTLCPAARVQWLAMARK